MITLIAGPPGAGKTTWAKDQAKPGDLIIDLDIIRQSASNEQTARALRSALEETAHQHDGDVYIVRTLADPKARAERAQALKADRTVVLATPPEEASRRAQQRDGNDEKAEPINRWWKTYQPNDGEEIITPATGTDPQPDKEEKMSKPNHGPEDQGEKKDEAKGTNEHGFPENTPISEMTIEEQASYWKHHARKHEDLAKARADYDEQKALADRYRALEEESKTPDQKAIDEAVAKARAEVEAQYSSKIFDVQFNALAKQHGLDDEKRQDLRRGVAPSQFIEDGAVNGEALERFFGAFAPAEPPAPKTPSGHGGFRDSKAATGKERGAELADKYIKSYEGGR